MRNLKSSLRINIALCAQHSDKLHSIATASYRSIRSESTLRLIDLLERNELPIDDIDRFICNRNNIGTFVTCSVDIHTNNVLVRMTKYINKDRPNLIPKNFVAGACIAYHIHKYKYIACKGSVIQ